LYILDHGSTIDPREIVSSKINVIRMPRGEADHRTITHFCNQFQRFLLSHYRWVIHIDVDELLVHKNGFEQFIQTLHDSHEPKIIRAGDAYNVVHNPLVEADLDLEQPVSLQRSHLVPEICYRKPVITSVPTTWAWGSISILNWSTWLWMMIFG